MVKFSRQCWVLHSCHPCASLATLDFVSKGAAMRPGALDSHESCMCILVLHVKVTVCGKARHVRASAEVLRSCHLANPARFSLETV